MGDDKEEDGGGRGSRDEWHPPRRRLREKTPAMAGPDGGKGMTGRRAVGEETVHSASKVGTSSDLGADDLHDRRWNKYLNHANQTVKSMFLTLREMNIHNLRRLASMKSIECAGDRTSLILALMAHAEMTFQG